MSSAMAHGSPAVPELIYHIALPQHWQFAMDTGFYTMSTRDATIADEGYMHASFESQVSGTLEKYYRDLPNVCVLVIDTRRVVEAGLRVVVEQLGRATEPYPHVYGPVPVDAIVRVRTLEEWNSGCH
jgi:glutathione S-transferase